MKRLLSITAVALISCSVFAPAAHAQFYNNYNNNFYNNNNINVTQSQLQTRIDRGIRTGALSRSEASSLQSKLRKFSQMEFNLRRSGNRLTFQERNRLNTALAKLSNEIQRQLTDSERRWNTRFSYNNNNNRPGWFR